MPITSLAVTTDDIEYSKWESGRNVVTAYVMPTPNTNAENGEEVTVQLMKARRDRDQIVFAQAILVAGAPLQNTRGQAVTFDLRNIINNASERINLCRRGDYFIRAIDVDNTQNLDAAAAVDVGGGLVGIPLTGHGFVVGQLVTLAGTANYNETYEVISLTGANQFNIRETFTAEVFDGTETAAASADSPDFRVALVTVNRLRRDWLFGSATKANDERMVRYQPTQITGVVVEEISKNHPLDVFPLNLDIYQTAGGTAGDTPTYTRRISWREGTQAVIDGTQNQRLVLPSADRRGYIIVRIEEPWSLPTTTQEHGLVREELLVDKDVMSEETLRRRIDEASDEMENSLLQQFLEPTLVVSEIDPSQIQFTPQLGALVPNNDYDALRQPITYYPIVPGRWIRIQMPFNWLLDVEQLFGAVANTRVIEIDNAWIIFDEPGGFIELVPFNQQAGFDFLGLVFVESLRSATSIPNFWHYRMWAGLRETPGDVLRVIGMKAAIPTLTVAGQAFRGGLASESVSRDGVSQSVSYTASAVYGVYSATIEDYRKEIAELMAFLKGKYRGLVLHVA